MDTISPLRFVGSLAAVNAALATVSYTPGTEDGGSDTLHFSSTSTEEPSVGGDISSVAATTVSITVTIAPETVTANNDVVTTVDDETPLVVSAAAGVLSNDVHDADDTLHVSKVNGSAANVGTQITLSSGAHLTLNADGSYTYDPSTMANIATGKAFHDSFTYTATDGHGDTSTATVTVTDSGPTGVTFNIDPATDPHSAVNANDSQLSFGELIGSFSAIGDTGDTFTYELGSAVTGFELTSAGQLYAADGDGDPTDSDEANEGHVGVGTYTLDVIATDQEGISSPATSYTVVVGDKQNNSINLGNGNQIAFGLDGNDTIAAVSGNAVLVGGSGNDVLIGGNGNNVLIGGLGADTMTGGGVSDTFVFNAIADSQPGSRRHHYQLQSWG
jgi:VCBS repeat-containing protein